MSLFNIFGSSKDGRYSAKRTRQLLAAGVLTAGLMLTGCNDNNDKGGNASGNGTGTSQQTASASNEDSSTNKEKDADATSAAPAEAPVPQVYVQTVGERDERFVREWPATTKSGDEVSVRARVEGTLENFSFREGMGVHAGQVLFTIDDAPYRAQLQNAKAQLAKAYSDLEFAEAQVNVRKAEADLASAKTELNRAQQDVDRYTPLAESGTIARQILDNAVATRDVAQANVNAMQANLTNTKLSDKANIDMAKANVEAAKSGVTQAELNIGYCVITSPINGIIGKLNVYPGNLVGQAGNTEALVELSTLDPIYANFSLSEEEYMYAMSYDDNDKKSSGVDWELIFSNGKVYPHKGKFGMLERTMDVGTGTIGVRIVFPNPDFILREGQFGKVRLSSHATEKLVVVPQRAVITTQSDHSVYVVDENNKVESRSIKISADLGDVFAVISGLKPGERIIVDGIQKVRPGIVCKPTVLEERPVISADSNDQG